MINIVWQWLRHGAVAENGQRIDRAFIEAQLASEIARVKKQLGAVYHIIFIVHNHCTVQCLLMIHMQCRS
jgi:malate synthase